MPAVLRALPILLLVACANPTPPEELASTSYAISSISCSERGDTGYVRGSAFAINVVTVDGKPVELDTANAYYVMAQAASAAGVEIRIVSGFRTHSQQQYLYNCYTSCSCNSCNLAARPGYSNHQSGHALDLNTSSSGVLTWLNANASRFGFSRTVPSEPWHWEWWGGGPGGGPCGARCEPACRGSRIVSADCGEGDCAAYGATCVDDALGVRCSSVFCPARGERRVCVNDTVIGHCDDGAISTGDCAPFAAVCSDAGASEARCVSVFCVDSRDEAPRAHDVCLPDGRLAHCNADGLPEDAQACTGGATCQSDGAGGFACLRGGESPRGALEVATCEGLGGWAEDPDEADAPVDIELYLDGGPADGAARIALRADEYRTDLCASTGSCEHAFTELTPLSLFDGEAHTVRAYGMNRLAGSNAELDGSPQTVRCAPPALTGVRRHVVDPESYAAWGLDEVRDLLPVEDASIDALPEGSPTPVLPRLVRDGVSDDVWMLDGAAKRFVDADAMRGWRFSEGQIETMDAAALSAIPEGPAVRSRPFAVRRSDGAVYLVDDEPVPAELGPDPVDPGPREPTPTEPDPTEPDPAGPRGTSPGLRGGCSVASEGTGAPTPFLAFCVLALVALGRRRRGAAKRRAALALGLGAALVVGGCVAPVDAGPDADLGRMSSSLSGAQRRTRAAQIRDAARANGITEGYLLAGIADAETTMAHCHSELTWACRGPASADCGGGPVAAGAGDGPCHLQQGGLGMFQFDAGTYADTLRREGSRVLSVAGNVAAAVDFVVGMVIRSAYVPGVSTREQAIAWINGVRVGNGRWDAWVRTVTHYYNGCAPSYSCFPSRYARYRDHTSGVYNEMGADFWRPCEATCLGGTRIRGTSCGEGDCAAYGATCVDDALGARCVNVFCEPRGDHHACHSDGDTLITCSDGAPVSTGSCGAFGARCVDDELGARCASVFCEDRGRHHACLPDGDTLLTCQDGGIESSGSCGAFGATCVADELGSRCVSVFCEPRGAHGACLPDSETLLSCDDGGITETVDCAEEGGTCVEDETGARCVSRHCPPDGVSTHCGSADLLLECDEGDVASSVDCSEEGGHCAEDAGGARCVLCPAEGRLSRCLGGGIVEVCADGEATAYECPAGEACMLDGGVARCAAPTSSPVTPPDAPPGRDPEPTPPERPPVSSGGSGGGCSVGAGRPAPAFALLAIAALLWRRRRRG